MKHLLTFAKAAAAVAIIVSVNDALAPKLPEALVIKGKDTRPYLLGAAVMMGLMMLPTSIKPVAAPAA